MPQFTKLPVSTISQDDGGGFISYRIVHFILYLPLSILLLSFPHLLLPFPSILILYCCWFPPFSVIGRSPSLPARNESIPWKRKGAEPIDEKLFSDQWRIGRVHFCLFPSSTRKPLLSLFLPAITPCVPYSVSLPLTTVGLACPR
jgi:hypothetical protein